MSDTRTEIDVDPGLARSLAERGFVAHPGDRILVVVASHGTVARRSRWHDRLRRVLTRAAPGQPGAVEHRVPDEPPTADDLPTFARSLKGAPDLAARSKEILRTELGR